jgi:hypothetical protein
MIAVFRASTRFSSGLQGLYALAFNNKMIYDTHEESVRGSRDDGMALTVNKVLHVLSDEHSKVGPGTGGGQTMYDGVNHVVFAVGQSHLKETNVPCLELPYVVI